MRMALNNFESYLPPAALSEQTKGTEMMQDDSQLGPPTMGDLEDEERRRIAYEQTKLDQSCEDVAEQTKPEEGEG
jgi:hypothetical protein